MLSAIDHDLDGVLLLLVERGDVFEPLDEAVDAHAREAGLARLLEHLAELALAVLRLAAPAAWPSSSAAASSSSSTISAAERADDLAAAQVAALLAGARVEHAQVVVDLGDRADRRARVGRGRLLLDGDGRRQAAELLVLGLLHLPEELPRIGRQRLDVAALPLGVERVERQRRLARPRHAGEHHQRALGDLQLIDGEVVLARAPHDDEVGLVGPAPGVDRCRVSSRCRFLATHEAAQSSSPRKEGVAEGDGERSESCPTTCRPIGGEGARFSMAGSNLHIRSPCGPVLISRRC